MAEQLFFKEVKAHFNLRSRKQSKPTNIYLVVCLNGKQHKFPTGVKVYPDHWNERIGEAITSLRLHEMDLRNNIYTNEVLSEMMGRFNEFKEFICSHPDKVINCEQMLKSYIYKDMEERDNNIKVEIDIISELYQAVETDTTISDGSRDNTKKGIKALDAFFSGRSEGRISNPKLITTELFIEMRDWLVDNYRKSNGDQFTVGTINDFLKLANIAVKKYGKKLGWYTSAEADTISYEQLKDKADKDEIALRDDEVLKLYNYQCDNPRDEIIKDLFLLECTIGQRISDTYRASDNTQIIEGVNVIKLVQKKTSKKISVDLIFEIAKNILVDKYHYDVPSIGKDEDAEKDAINKRIKEIAKKAGITGTEKKIIHKAGDSKPIVTEVPRYKMISTHTGRRTFVTMLSLRGWNYVDIGRYTGQTPKTVEDYDKSKGSPDAIAIFKQTKDQHLKMLGQEENATTKHDTKPSKKKASAMAILFAEPTLLELAELKSKGMLTPDDYNTARVMKAVSTIKNIGSLKKVKAKLKDYDKEEAIMRVKAIYDIVFDLAVHYTDSEILHRFQNKAVEMGWIDEQPLTRKQAEYLIQNAYEESDEERAQREFEEFEEE